LPKIVGFFLRPGGQRPHAIPEGLDGSRDARWYRAEAVRLREWGSRITHDPELRASYFSLAREYDGLADILDGKDTRKRPL